MAQQRRSIFNPFSWFGANSSNSLEDKIENIINKRNNAITKENGTNFVKDAKSFSVANILKTLKSKVLSAIDGGMRGTFIKPEWDFKKIHLAFSNESIFRRAVEKYVEQIRKHEWEFVGNNPNTVKYIRKRFDQMATVTNKPTSELFDEIAFNLVLYSNALVVKQRNRKASGGKERKTFDGYKRVPVAGYFCVDPSTVEVDRDEYGNVRKWKQLREDTSIQRFFSKELNNDTEVEWPAYNMIHIKDKGASPSNYFFAMPMSVPVIADMQALRELEELLLLESIKVAVPKLHAKVGSKEQPGTQEQVDDLAATIRNLTGDGVMITTERVTIEDVAKATSANNILTAALTYFRARVLAGLGMSDIAMGQGDTANRATAQVMNSEIQSTSAKFQRILKKAIEFHIIRELLYESGYTEWTLDDESMVTLSIPEVALQEKITREAHHLNLYLSNGITHSELRKELGKDLLEAVQEEDMYLNRVSIPLAEAGSVSDTPQQNASNNTSRPSNQHGTQLARPKVSKDSYHKLWNSCLNVRTRKKLLDTLTKSDLDPYDITILQVMISNYLNTYNLKDTVKFVFTALEDKLT